MRTFVLTYFWMILTLTIIRIIEIGCREWPEVRKPKSLGLAVAETMLGALGLIWAGFILWTS